MDGAGKEWDEEKKKQFVQVLFGKVDPAISYPSSGSNMKNIKRAKQFNQFHWYDKAWKMVTTRKCQNRFILGSQEEKSPTFPILTKPQVMDDILVSCVAFHSFLLNWGC